MASRLITLLISVALIAFEARADPYERDIVLEGAIGQVAAASKLAQQYSSLGEVLGDKNKHIEGEPDIYEVVGKVKKIMDEWESTFILSKLMKQKPSENAVRLFTSLPSGIIQCNFQGYMILASNYAAAIGNDRYLNPTDQIKSAVWAAIEAHGQICRWEYFARFRDTCNAISPKLMEELKQLLNNELLDEILAKDLKNSLRTTNLFAGFKSRWASLLLDRLVSVVNGNPEANYMKAIPSEASLGGKKSEFEINIVYKYLVEPCRSFTYELTDVLEPAKLDLALDDDFMTEINPEHSYLLRDAWRRYLVCSMVNINSSLVGRELTNLARKKF